MAKRSRPVKTTPAPAASGVEAPAGAEPERSEEDQTTVGAALDLGSDAAHPSISMGDDPDVLPENASPEVSASRSPQATSANEGRESMPFPRASEPYDGKPPTPAASGVKAPAASASPERPRQASSASERSEGKTGKTGKYTQRIRVTEAFQYMGTLKDAPDFIDRSWLARTPRDDRRALPAGPGLKVPTKAGVVYCWPGDYVAVQSYADTGDQELVVWERELFERLFTQASEE